MSKSKELASFILGAAVGMAIVYFINSDNREEFMSNLKEKAGKFREGLEDQLDKGKDLLNSLKGKGEEAMDKAQTTLNGK